MVSFKGAHIEATIILMCVRWYLAYPLSDRHVEEMMQERGVAVDHSTINRWVLKHTVLGFKSADTAQRTLAGIELMCMIKKRQMAGGEGHARSPAERFYSLAA
jgi:transposase-like protein